MTPAESLWLKIIGVLLILVGLVLLASPRITYERSETVIHTRSAVIRMKRPRTIVIPRPAAAAIIAAGVAVILVARRKART